MKTMSLNETGRALMRKIESSRLLERYDPDEAIELLDSVRSDQPYHSLPGALREFWSALSRDFGEEGFDAFQRLTMVRLMERFDIRATGKHYTDSIRQCFTLSLTRITRSIENPAFEEYRSVNDILLKDLAICGQKLFPAGAQVVETDSGFSRSFIFRGGLHQALRFLRVLLATGNKHFYQIHTHLSELEEFNPEGWDRCYVRLAEMLELNPDIKGVYGGSWFYDPALEKISPRLVYLRERPQQNGATLLYSGVDLAGGALAKSQSRQNLYKQGKYVPKSYGLVWPRKPLMSWAHRFRDADRSTYSGTLPT